MVFAMAQPAAAPEAFTEIAITYAPWATEADRYSPEDERRCTEFLGAIVADAEVLRPMLHEDFAHIDSALVFEGGQPVVRHVGAVVGRDPFVDGFRRMVNDNTEPDGGVYGTWVPAADYDRVIAPQVEAQLPEGVTLTGRLIGALAARFEYRLREDGVLDLPPALHGLLAEGEEPFEPHHAHGPDAPRDLDNFSVNVVVGIYADENGNITARAGSVYDDPSGRAVPIAIHHQLSVREAGGIPASPAPVDVASRIHYAQAA